ncbi:Sec-independent protein translocase protein TatB [Parathalassolituus penaei]|uniref:Sec-independent protein translocase protein TatB n=1 Tax=Parathalassolituus penaei TaxID=2997323 RepID=A0A9X3IR92_9GAMM|nr:Sec-independent protein translocase protein TatB [Parathalassolituus penaei]MCY0965002.1 Sec-independent protein translocase protein TatB [Parathalassolituus penaei]
MFDIGFSELLLIGVLGLIVLGPEKLPGAARTLGLLIGRARRTINGFQDELERQVRAEELREKLKDPYATFLNPEEEAQRRQAEAMSNNPAAASPATAASADPVVNTGTAFGTTTHTINTSTSNTSTITATTDASAATTASSHTGAATAADTPNTIQVTPTIRSQDNQPAS